MQPSEQLNLSHLIDSTRVLPYHKEFILGDARGENSKAVGFPDKLLPVVESISKRHYGLAWDFTSRYSDYVAAKFAFYGTFVATSELLVNGLTQVFADASWHKVDFTIAAGKSGEPSVVMMLAYRRQHISANQEA